MAETIKEKLEEAGHRISEKATEVGHAVGEKVEQVTDWAKEKSHQAGNTLEEMGQKAENRYDETFGGVGRSGSIADIEEHMNVMSSCETLSRPGRPRRRELDQAHQE